MRDKGTSADRPASGAARETSERGDTLQQIMDTASVAIFLVDKSGRITHANRRMTEMFGCAPEELVGSEYIGLVHPSEREVGRRKMLALLASEIESVDLERHYWRRDGTEFWGHLAGRRFHDVRGNELGLIGVITDIDQRKRAEQRLRESETRLNAILENVGASIFIKDAQYRYTYVNRKVCEVFGKAPEEILGKGDEAFFSGESVEEILQSDRRVIERGETVAREEIGLATTDGPPRTYWVVKLPLRDGSGAIAGLCGIATDITERKRAEAALIQSEAKFRRLYNETPVLMHSIDRNGVVVEVNDYWLQTLGYGREEVIGRKVTDFYTEASRRYSEEVVQPAFFRDGVAKDIAYQFVRKNGDVVDVVLSATAERDAAGNVVRSQAVIEDVTEGKRAEAALRESEERFKAITTTASDAILLMDDKGSIVYWNPAAERIFGYPAREALGRELHLFLAPRRMHESYLLGLSRFALTGQGPVVNKSVEMTAKKSDGTEFPIEVSTSAMRIGGRWHALGIVRDITGRKRLEQELLKTQKLESIGTLAGGIAHDFNNLLQGVFGYISMAKASLDQKPKSLAMLERAEAALHQSVNLTSQLLTFSKGGKPVKRVLALQPVIENAVRFALSGSRVAFTLSLDDGLSTVEADEGQVGQVLQNIVLNAEQAMPLGGRIEIFARNVPAADIAHLPGMAQGDAVEIRVVDQGLGIPAEHLPRIFDPYFTTKEKGSGLGLATAYSILRNHGGAITVASELGKGSVFTVYLPASGAPAQRAPSSAAGPALRPGRVLVMDDERVVRDVALELLRELGHEAASAENGEAAIALYREALEAGKPFDVVILDLTIRGGLGGTDTMRALLEIDPGVKAIVSSGYSDDASLATYREQGFKAFLKKPYVMKQLNAVLGALLE